MARAGGLAHAGGEHQGKGMARTEARKIRIRVDRREEPASRHVAAGPPVCWRGTPRQPDERLRVSRYTVTTAASLEVFAVP